MDTTVTRISTAIRRAQEARVAETSIYNPLPPFEEVTQPWKMYWDVYRKADFWSRMPGMAAWRSRPQTNIPFQVVQTNTTLLTDARPMVIPFSDSGHMEDATLAEWLKAAFLQWWNSQAGDIKVVLGVQPSRIYGIGWWRLDADSDGQTWETVHPDCVYVSPDTTVDSFLVREPTYLVYEYETQFSKLKATFPKAGYKHKPKWDEFDPDFRVSAGSEWEYSRPIDDISRIQPTKMVKVYQLWEQSDSEDTWKETIGESEVTMSKPKYKRGKVTTMAGGVVLDVRENPHEHGQYPFTPIFAYLAPGQFYPIGDIQNILPDVIMRNRMKQLYYDAMIASGGGKIYLGRGSGLKQGNVTNAQFEVIEVPGDVNQIRTERPPAARRDSLEFMSVLDRDIDNSAGIHDISKGARTAGNPVTAQEAAMLGESDRTRIRLASRLLTWSLNRHVGQWCYNAAQYEGETEYVFAVNVGEDGQIPGFEDAAKVPMARTFKEIFNESTIDKGLRYGLKFAEFSSLPSSLNEDKNLAIQLYQTPVDANGIIDAEDLLLAMDWPNARATAKKAQERSAKAAEAAKAQAQQMPSPAPAPQGAPMPPDSAPMPAEAPIEAQGAPSEPVMPDTGIPPEVMTAVQALIDEGASPEEAVQSVLSQMGAS